MKKYILFFSSFLCCMFLQAQLPSYIPTNGLVGYWPFNGNANDESGNGNNGTIMGDITYISDRFGTSNSAIQCANTTDIICTANSYNNPQVFSTSLWFNTTTTGYIFGFDNGQCAHGGQWDRYLYVNSSGNIEFYLFSGGEKYCITSGNYLDGIWHHVVYRLSPVGMQIYVDGVLTAQNLSVNSAEVYTGYWRVGGLNAGSGPTTMVGKVDDIGIWNRVLTQQEITDLYNSQICSAAITLNGPSSFCSGQNQSIGLSVDSSGSTYKQYLWSTGDTTPSVLVNPTQTTKYKVTVTQDGLTCKDSITITVNAKPVVSPTATPPTICQGQSTTITANATAGSGTISSYSWSSGLVGNVSGGSVTPINTTTYTVTVINSNNCSSIASTTVTVNAKPVVSPTATPPTICQGQSSTIAANATAGSGTISSYVWSSGLVGNISGGAVSPNVTTTYTATVKNSNNCTTSASVIVNVNTLPIVNINSFPAFVNINAAPIILSGSPVGGNFTGQGISGTSFYPSSAGLGRKQILYSYTNANGCSNSANSSTIVYDTIVCHVSVTDTLVIHTILTGILPPNNINTIKVYPNPTSDQLYINTGSYSLMNGYSIKIINPLAQVVFQNLINQQLFNLSLSSWARGSYILQILDVSNNIIETKVLLLQ